MIGIRGVVLYPFFAAVYPVLALATTPGEIQGLWVLAWPLGISLFVAICAWLLCSLFVKDRDRRAFATFMIVVLFASYGYFVLILGDVEWAASYAGTIVPFLLLLSYLAAMTFLVLRLVPNVQKLTRFLTILTGILLVWNGGLLLVERLRWNSLVRDVGRRDRNDSPAGPTAKGGPDIYLIVLDKYTGSSSLKANFDFDNSDFERFLREHGFVLPRRAQANYIFTSLSLASLLNYRYLDSLPGAERRKKAYVSRVIEDNAAWRFLEERGYRFIFFPTGFPFTGNNRKADLQVPDPHQILSEFEIVWRRTTLAEPLISWVCQRIRCPHGPAPFADEATFLEWRFDRLREVPTWPRDGHPLFVFAHLTLPHEPYIFNADCSVRQPFWPSYFAVRDETPEKQAYTAQIACLNERLKVIVARLLSGSPAPPIILLQSDHGHGRMPLHIPDVDGVTPDRIAERADIFAAYHLPGADSGIVWDSISPVNLFPMVFRQYFRADLPRLPDRTYWSPGTELFRFTRVQDGRPIAQ